MSQPRPQANQPSKITEKSHREHSQKFIPQDYLLEVLLDHPDYADFTPRQEDYRNWSEKSPSYSLSLKGWKDFKSDEGGSLFDLVKKFGLVDEARKRAGLTDPRQQKSSYKSKKSPGSMFPPYEPNEDTLTGNLFEQTEHHKSDTTVLAGALWQQLEDQSARSKVLEYLDSRSIPPESYSDLLGSHIHCVLDRGHHLLVMAMLTPDQVNQAAAGTALQSVQKIHRVYLSDAGRCTEKKQLGSPTDDVGRVSYIPPLSANGESLQYLVCEGLEDALSIRSKHPEHHFLICQSKGNLKNIPNFLPEGAEVLIISDHDGHENPNQNGETAAAKLYQELLKLSYNCRALMPPEPKNDANDALRAGELEKWLDQLVELSPSRVLMGSQFDISEVVRGSLPLLPRGIIRDDLEQYLGYAAESLDLNYESAFCELLGNVSFAIGGNKTIVVKENWQEKALLWMASIGASGLGKTPLNRICGGELLELQQHEWHQQYLKALEQWNDQEPPRPERPVRKRCYSASLTMERLCSLHQENKAGIGVHSGEIMGVIDGLNQYKGRGNDRQKLLSLWNGHSFDNPTNGEDRYIPSVFVPVIGGIQESLVSKIINSENTTDGLAARFLFNHLLISKEPLSIERQQQLDELMSKSEGKQSLNSLFKKIMAIRDQEHSVLINKEAKNYLQSYEYYLKLEARKGNENTFAAYGKLRTYIYRIALTIHYLVEQFPDDVELSEQTALNTLNVMRFLSRV